MRTTVLVLMILTVALASDPGLFMVFKNWQIEHQKDYSNDFQEQTRFLIFKKNVELINEMNSEKYGGEDVEFALNQFADLTQAEFQQEILMPNRDAPTLEKERYLEIPVNEKPNKHDWREHGAVNAVKDQGTVGTCWAFSTVGNVEGVNFKKTGKLIRLAEEQLVDCDGTTDEPKGRADCGVFGGWPYLSLQYISKNGGLDPEQDYPYCVGGGKNPCYPCQAPGFMEKLCGPPVLYCDPVKYPCKVKRSDQAVKIADWAAISTDEEEIAQQLVNVGPLSILMNASMLQFYKKGVYNPLRCDPQSLNHAVLLIGYSDMDASKTYWIIKNSWGTKWGEDGFFRIIKGKGKCGVNSFVVTAII